MKGSNGMSDRYIPVGTEFAFPTEPEVRWRVIERLRDRESDGEQWTVYRCEQIDGDRTLYANDRNEDGTIDMVGDEIVRALDGRL
jgi:hypothetical protein